jgi:hypothetical protein
MIFAKSHASFTVPITFRMLMPTFATAAPRASVGGASTGTLTEAGLFDVLGSEPVARAGHCRAPAARRAASDRARLPHVWSAAPRAVLCRHARRHVSLPSGFQACCMRLDNGAPSGKSSTAPSGRELAPNSFGSRPPGGVPRRPCRSRRNSGQNGIWSSSARQRRRKKGLAVTGSSSRARSRLA